MEGTSSNQDKGLQAHSSEKGIDAGIVFGRDSHFAFIYKKTEKLVTAVYMVSDFIKDNEPLKWKIRESALSLLELNLDFGAVSFAEREDLIREYRTLVLEVVSLSSIAHHSGLISEMNFNILSREFNNLVSALEKGASSASGAGGTLVLDPGFFTVDEQPSRAPLDPKGHVSRTAPSPAPLAPAPVQIQKSEYLPLKDMREKAPRPTEAKADSKESRQATILKLLSKKGGLSVKDFAEAIKGVSEKTIQRELLAMVASGVLKKEGERRWSTYSLKSSQ